MWNVAIEFSGSEVCVARPVTMAEAIVPHPITPIDKLIVESVFVDKDGCAVSKGGWGWCQMMNTRSG